MNLVGRVHESSSARATERHFVRALDGELRGIEGYRHVLASGLAAYVFVVEVTEEVVAAIEAAGGEITGVESGKHSLRVRIEEVSG